MNITASVQVDTTKIRRKTPTYQSVLGGRRSANRTAVKEEAKNFCRLGRAYPGRRSAIGKSFLVFFKKELLSVACLCLAPDVPPTWVVTFFGRGAGFGPRTLASMRKDVP
jgi:hypothetical protein